MKAVTIRRHGGPEVVQVREVILNPAISCGSCVRVDAAS
jgi:hypothetical protein